MSEFRRSPKTEIRSYGSRSDTSIETDGKDICTTIYQSRHPARASRVYVMANGLTANRYSMHLPSKLAAQNGDIAITFDYRSKSFARGAIERNVNDCADVVEAARAKFGLTVCLIGLSMGGEVVLKTAARPDVQENMRAVDDFRPSVNAVAAAGLTEEGIPLLEAIKRAPNIAGETGALMLTHLIDAVGIAQACGAHTVRRSLGVIGDVRDLTGGVNARTDVALAANGSAKPLMRTINGLHDGLILKGPQSRGVEDLQFDQKLWYSGGHCALAFNPSLSNLVIYGSLN
jgi:pimeloyl-ACP methyl ester carboxylesterase